MLVRAAATTLQLQRHDADREQKAACTERTMAAAKFISTNHSNEKRTHHGEARRQGTLASTNGSRTRPPCQSMRTHGQVSDAEKDVRRVQSQPPHHLHEEHDLDTAQHTRTHVHAAHRP